MKRSLPFEEGSYSARRRLRWTGDTCQLEEVRECAGINDFEKGSLKSWPSLSNRRDARELPNGRHSDSPGRRLTSSLMYAGPRRQARPTSRRSLGTSRGETATMTIAFGDTDMRKPHGKYRLPFLCLNA